MRRLALIAPLVLTAAAEAGPGLWFVGMPPQAEDSWAYGLSRDGSVAVGGSFGIVDSQPFGPGYTWTQAGGRYDFGLEPGMPGDSFAFAIADDNSTIVGHMFTGGNFPFPSRPYRRVGDGPLQDLGLLGAWERGTARGISGDGKAVIGWCEGGMSNTFGEAFRWTEQGGMEGLGYLKPGGSISQALGISRDGSTIVGTSQSAHTEAFRWTESSGMVELPGLPGAPFVSVHANAVNADGSVIVGNAPSDHPVGYAHAVRWDDGVVTDLGTPPGYSRSGAYAVSDDGTIIGGVAYTGLPRAACMWIEGRGVVLLADYLADLGVIVPAEFRLEQVYAISGDGLTIAGIAENLNTGHEQGFVATIPSPGSAVLLTLGPFLVGRRRRS